MRIIKITDAEIILFLSSLMLVCFVLGVTLNFLVMTSNGGKMPIYTTQYVYEDSNYFTFADNSEVSYPMLSDRIYISKNIYSIGDIVMIISVFLYVLSLIIYFGIKFKELSNS